jgi:putative transposase
MVTPFYGSRRMVWFSRQGYQVCWKRIQRLMRTMGLTVVYRRPRTSRPAPGHKVYPYLLRGIEITKPNQVWAADITYLPMAREFLYLVLPGKDPTHWLSKGRPEIFNADQGSQFTGESFTALLEQDGAKISMDGKGWYIDNIFVKRLWRTGKYEEVYLKAYSNGREAKDELDDYFRFYNTRRSH